MLSRGEIKYSRPVLLGNDANDSLDHLLADGHGLVTLPLLKGLSNAEDDLDSGIKSSLGPGGDGLRGILEESSSLRVTGKGVLDSSVDEHLRGDLSGEGSVGLGVDVLGGDVEVEGGLEGGEVGGGGDEVEGRRSNDDLWKRRSMILRGEEVSKWMGEGKKGSTVMKEEEKRKEERVGEGRRC